MIVHKEYGFVVGYGNIYNSFDKEFVTNYQKFTAQEILNEKPFSVFKELLGIAFLVKTKQVHGCEGVIVINNDKISNPFLVSADYSITNLSDIGLAISTADCLPIMFYDDKNRVIAAAHAGWRGVKSNIVWRVFKDMQKNFNTQPKNIRIFIGPSGGACCYEVKDDVLEQFQKFSFFKDIVRMDGDKIFLNLVQAVLLQLKELGVEQEKCDVTYNICTLCSPTYASHRRDADGKRNLTVIALKEKKL